MSILRNRKDAARRVYLVAYLHEDASVLSGMEV